MSMLTDAAEAALQAAPHPALRLTELLEIVRRGVDRSITGASLRARLEQRPDRFRLLEAWSNPSSGRVRPRRVARHAEADVWVVSVRAPSTPPDTPRPALRLRESVRWVALGLDGRSRLQVARWRALAERERETRRAVLGQAA